MYRGGFDFDNPDVPDDTPKPGDRVRLAAFEDSPEEVGTLDSIEDGMAYVFVDDEYKVGPCDDGLRELPLDQIIEVMEGGA